MKTLSIEQMEVVNGGWRLSAEKTTGLLCGFAVALAFTGPFAPIAAAPAIGCAIGAIGGVLYN